jgi:hypothetical protein
MGHYRGISSRRAENPACFKVHWRVGLDWEAKRSVVAENAAFLEKARRTNRLHHIVEEKIGKVVGSTPWEASPGMMVPVTKGPHQLMSITPVNPHRPKRAWSLKVAPRLGDTLVVIAGRTFTLSRV